MINATEIKNRLQAENDTEATFNSIHNILVVILRPFEGKQITRRVFNAFKETYPEYTCFWKEQYSWVEIEIHGGPLNLRYDNRVGFQICYDTDRNHFRMECFEKCDAQHGSAAVARMAARQAIIESPEKLQALADGINRVTASRNLLAIAEEALSKTEGADDYSIRKLAE